MSEVSALRVLWLSEGASAAASAPGLEAAARLVVDHAAGLDAYTLADPADAVVVSLAGGEALDALLNWPALSPASVETAVVVFTPGIDDVVADRLVQGGVQDVVTHADAGSLWPRLRFAIERKRLEHEARKAYAMDLMTGLPNRSQFVEHMSQLIALRERENSTVHLMVLRVDGITGVESGHGPEAANAVRRKVAVRLRAGLRASDVVASLGADVFAVLLPSTDTLPDVQRVAGKLTRALREPFKVAGSSVGVSAHVGVAQFPQDGHQPDELLRHASASALTRAFGGGAAND